MTRNGAKKFVFGLPGNPVSALVTAFLFVLPFVNELSGFKREKKEIMVEIAEDIQLDSRCSFIRASVLDGIATTTGIQLSSTLMSMKGADCLLKLPSKLDGEDKLPKGSKVVAMAWN